MNNVEFDENYKKGVPGQLPTRTGSKMGDWLVKKGIAASAESANLILIIFGIVIFALSIYVFIYGFNLPPTSTPQSIRPINPEAFPPGIE